MNETPDIDLVCAEYALGTLDAGEREAVAARAAMEPAVAALIEAWTARLAPLIAYSAAVGPGPGVIEAIRSRLDAIGNGPASSAAGTPPMLASNVIALARSRSRWRMAAVSFGTLAASLVAFIGVREAMVPPTPTTFVAVLQKDAASPAFLLTVDTWGRSLTVRPVSAPAEPGKSYELWLVHDSLKAPRSLGLLSEKAPVVNASLGAYGPDVVRNATYAVSLEPAGGSKTGVPTGPVVYAGRLIESTP